MRFTTDDRGASIAEAIGAPCGVYL